MTEDEMVGWHHRLNGYQFESTPGVGDGQGNWQALPVNTGLPKTSGWGQAYRCASAMDHQRSQKSHQHRRNKATWSQELRRELVDLPLQTDE